MSFMKSKFGFFKLILISKLKVFIGFLTSVISFKVFFFIYLIISLMLFFQMLYGMIFDPYLRKSMVKWFFFAVFLHFFSYIQEIAFYLDIEEYIYIFLEITVCMFFIVIIIDIIYDIYKKITG